MAGFAYGVCVGPTGRFDEIARPGIHFSDPDATIIVRTNQSSIFEAYNSILAEVSTLDVEGLVLLHDDTELCDPDIATKLRRCFADLSIGVVGAIGARDVRSMHWWRYHAVGRAAEPGLLIDYGIDSPDVEVVDGILIAMSPYAIQHLRFDAHRYHGFHGYDMDVCMTAKEMGLRVVVTDIRLVHHSLPHGKITNPDLWKAANLTWQRKWGRKPGAKDLVVIRRGRKVLLGHRRRRAAGGHNR